MPGDDELRIVQRERVAVRVTIVRVHLAGRGGLAGAKRFQQLFRLPLQLGEVRVLADGASRQGSVHDELLSWLSVSARWPGVRSFGQKRVHQRVMNPARACGDTVLSADTEAPQRGR
jgi:hypothetical protein